MKPTQIAINQIPSKQTTSQLLAEKMTCLLNNVRNRAYELFERRGRDHGYDLDDWFRAETELGVLPTATIEETETEMRIRVERSEFSADQLKVYAEPQAITVEGSARPNGRVRRFAEPGPSALSMGGTNYQWKSTRDR